MTSTPGSVVGRSAIVPGSVSSSLKQGIWMITLTGAAGIGERLPTAFAAAPDERCHTLSPRDDVESEAEGDGDLHGVERHVVDGSRQPFGGRQLDGVGEAHGLLAEQPGGPVEAALVHGDDGVAVPLQAHGVLEVAAQRRLVGQTVDDGERLGERERADAHRAGGGVESLLRHGLCRRVDVQRDHGSGVEERRQLATSSTAHLAEGAVEAHAAPDGDRFGEASGMVTARRQEGAGGDEGLECLRSADVLDGTEHSGRPTADGDRRVVARRPPGAGASPGRRAVGVLRSAQHPCVPQCTHDRRAYARRRMEPISWAFAALAAVAVFVLAAVVVGREAHRLDAVAPRSVYVVDEAVEFVAEYVPPETQARLTPAELEQLLTAHMRWLHAKGLQPANVVDRRQDITTPVVFSEDSLAGYLLAEAERRAS